MLLFSVAVIAFWNFRHTEWPPARRVFSVANVNDFSWRNRVTAWQGAARMMRDRPPRLAETAAIQMNDHLMLATTLGLPALFCFGAYIFLAVAGGRLSVIRGRSPETADHGPLTTDLWLPTACRAGAVVLLVAFWFDGGLFKLPTAVVFWALVELGRNLGSLRTQKSATSAVSDGEFATWGHAADNTAPPRVAGRVPQPGDPGGDRSTWTIAWRWLAGLVAVAALAQTALHLVTPRLAVSPRILDIARRHLIQPGERADFAFVASHSAWTGRPLRTLLEHVQLANYNRELVNWKLDDDLYRAFVLSPEIDPLTDGTLRWRRMLWEYFHPRIRREYDVEAAAGIVARHLRERVAIRSDASFRAEVRTIWTQGMTDEAGFERIYVAALRSVGIAARLNDRGQAELLADEQWRPAPRVPD